MLRDYQQRSIDQLYAWFAAGNEGNPCLVLPTGSGKSHIVAALCKDALQNWPETRILMLTHVKELLEQNAEKMRQHWPNAPMGIYSASVGKRQLGEPITFAGIQSVRNKASQIGHIDLVLIDEAHTVGHAETGGYRTLLAALWAINPGMRVIGLTATPYRLGHGYITDKPAIFDALLEPVTIEELIFKGHLATLRSKITSAKLDSSGLAKRGGEFAEADMQRAFDVDWLNEAVVDEIIARADGRKHWLLFCAGVEHARHIAATLNARGIVAASVTGDMNKTDREATIAAYKAGKITALTNAQVLTTGFDFPGIDLIAFLRATMSPGLYMQMAGRGLRPKPHTDYCLVLDFAGVVERHGPITAVQPPKRKGEGTGEAPSKKCDNCGEICHAAVAECPACGHAFPAKELPDLALRNVDIMGLEASEMAVSEWNWREHMSRTSGKEMLAVIYYGDLSDRPVTEYLPVAHEGYAGQKALNLLATICANAGVQLHPDSTLQETADALNDGDKPALIRYRRDGKFDRVTAREW